MTEGIRVVVDTLEGRIGPLLAAVEGGCHFIEMPAGLFLAELAHSTESLIYTACGEWVLCSQGDRYHMTSGSLYWFGAGVPTGCEVPFPEPATILIFKTEAPDPTFDFIG